jgi:hypothetical protein
MRWRSSPQKTVAVPTDGFVHDDGGDRSRSDGQRWERRFQAAAARLVVADQRCDGVFDEGLRTLRRHDETAPDLIELNHVCDDRQPVEKTKTGVAHVESEGLRG